MELRDKFVINLILIILVLFLDKVLCLLFYDNFIFLFDICDKLKF